MLISAIHTDFFTPSADKISAFERILSTSETKQYLDTKPRLTFKSDLFNRHFRYVENRITSDCAVFGNNRQHSFIINIDPRNFAHRTFDF